MTERSHVVWICLKINSRRDDLVRDDEDASDVCGLIDDVLDGGLLQDAIAERAADADDIELEVTSVTSHTDPRELGWSDPK